MSSAAKQIVSTFSQRVLSVGGNDIATHPLPQHYFEFQQETLDIDPSVGATVVCDARDMASKLEANQYDAIYCSHNLEHYYTHDVPKVLRGFLHILKPDGWAEIWVPDIPAVMQECVSKHIELDVPLYQSEAGPISALDILYGWRKQIEESGQEFYAHKTGFSQHTLYKTMMEAGFAAAYPIQRGSRLEIGVLAFKAVPSEQTKRIFNLS